MGRTSFGQWKEVGYAPSQRHQEKKGLQQLACQSARDSSLQAIAAGDFLSAQHVFDPNFCSSGCQVLTKQCHASL